MIHQPGTDHFVQFICFLVSELLKLPAVNQRLSADIWKRMFDKGRVNAS